MIEIRWVDFGEHKHLEYRYFVDRDKWSNWEIVETVAGIVAAQERLDKVQESP
jgi:hypothetical protein